MTDAAPSACECVEGEHTCDACMERLDAYWRAYFGFQPGMTRAEWRALLESWAPEGKP